MDTHFRSPLPLEAKLAAGWPLPRWTEETVVVAVSGGADSMALLRALAALRPEAAGGKLVVAHLNHGLRGFESDRDAGFVVQTAGELGLQAIATKHDVGLAAEERGDGIEEAARELRYRFLIETARSVGSRYIATAHTLDDQAETLLQRIVRGTGLTGLAGIPRVRGIDGATIGLIRPMLMVRRSEVLEYLTALGQAYREDSSNTDRAYTRNRIRHDLLPQLAREYNPKVVDALANLATQAEEMQAALRPAIEELLRTSLRSCGDQCFELDFTAVHGAPRHLIREVLVAAWKEAGLPQQDMGFAEWIALAEMVCAPEPVKRMFPGSVTAATSDSSLRVCLT